MSNETIFRTHKRKEDPFVRVDKDLVNDSRLGWDTRGLLTYLLGKPNDWTVRMSDLMQQGPAKLTALRRMIKEAEAYGYMRRERHQGRGGKFIWITHVYEVPDEPSAGYPSMGDPSADDPSADNLPIYQPMNLLTNELLTNDLTNQPPPPPIVPSSNGGGGGGGGGPAPIRTHSSHFQNTNGHHPTRSGLPPQPADHLAMRTLALGLIADNLPAWNNPAAHVATREAADLHNLLAWLWLLDRIRQAETASPYSVEAYYDAGAVDEYRAAIHGVRDLAAFVISRTGGGASPQHQAPKLCDADAAALAAAICAIESEANCESDPHD